MRTNDRKADSMRTYILRDFKAVEPQSPVRHRLRTARRHFTRISPIFTNDATEGTAPPGGSLGFAVNSGRARHSVRADGLVAPTFLSAWASGPTGMSALRTARTGS